MPPCDKRTGKGRPAAENTEQGNDIERHIQARYGVAAADGTSLTLDELPDDLSPVDRIVVPQAFAMHCTRREIDGERAGNLFHIQPAYGDGTYWYFAVDDALAVSHFDMSFAQALSFSCPTPPFWCFGAYNRTMIPYFGIEDDPAERTLLGYAWRLPSYTQSIEAGDERFRVTSILALPEGMKRLAVEFGCPPEKLERAVTMLDGSMSLPTLNVALDEIAHARPSARTARAYYRAKVIEAFSLILDRSDALGSAPHAQLSAADKSALNIVRTYLAEHLDRVVPTEELARRVYMSTSKLARLFRQVEDMTVQGYARALRMERACELLEKSDLSMADIASALAFERQGSFSEAFKTRFGISPREFRNMRRGR